MEMPSIRGRKRIQLGDFTGWWIELSDIRIHGRLIICDDDGNRTTELIDDEDQLEEGLWIEYRDGVFAPKVLELFLWRPGAASYFCIEPLGEAA